MPAPFVLVPPGRLDDVGAGERVLLPDGARHHLTDVLRLREGMTVEVADGEGVEATARFAGSSVILTVPPVTRLAPRPALHVLQALGKGRKHDDVVRTLTELGVDRITAVTTERTVVDLSGKVDRALERWLAVATAACAQARRPWLPDVDGPVTVGDAIADLDGAPCLVAHVGARRSPLDAASDLADADRVVLAVGPEGGWTDDEVAAFERAGAVAVGLGPTVLRTEHAAAALAAVVAAAVGRMDPVAPPPA